MIERMRLSEIFREYGIDLVLALLVIGFSIVAPGFASVTNFILILLQVSVMGILSIGMLFVILSRGIDLSVGSILAVSGMFAGLLAKQDLSFVNVALAFSVPIALGLLCGMFNGALIAWVRLPALIVTLGTMYAFRGFIVWYHVNPIYQLQPWFRVLGQEKIGPIPIPVIILLVMTFVASVLLNRTRFGRYVYAVGGNEDAARASGINVKLVKLGVYSISGFFCGLAGLVFTSRLGAAQSISGWDSSLSQSPRSWSAARACSVAEGRSGRRLSELSLCRSCKAVSSCSTSPRRSSRQRSVSSSSSRLPLISSFRQGGTTRSSLSRCASSFQASEPEC